MTLPFEGSSAFLIPLLLLQNLSLVYLFVGNGLSLLFIGVSCWALVQYHRRNRFQTPEDIVRAKVTPPISLLVPAFNEGKTIVSSVNSLMKLRYPEFEVIVINDGSPDDTLDVLVRNFSLRKTREIYHHAIETRAVRAIYRSGRHPNLVVIDKENGGKADSLNAGINTSQHPLFCAIDADSVLEPEALLRVVRPFMERYQETVAVGGIVRIANGCRIQDGVVTEVDLSSSLLPNIQVVEYLRAFLSSRLGFSELNALLVISGAFGVFKKDPVLEVGGYSTETVGEDMELVVHLHRHLRGKGATYRIVFVPDPVCWTEVPETLRVLGRQRSRWHCGLGQVLSRHKSMFLNPRYGTVGVLAFPYFVLVEFLSPVVELAGLGVLVVSGIYGVLWWKAAGAFMLLSFVMGILMNILTVLLEEVALGRYPRLGQLSKLILAGSVEGFGYRQLHCYWRLRGFFQFLRGENIWGRMERKGLERT